MSNFNQYYFLYLLLEKNSMKVFNSEMTLKTFLFFFCITLVSKKYY